MLLAIDVGNSHTVSGVFRGDELLCHWRVRTDRKETADELAARFHTFFRMRDLVFTDINGVCLASVVPTQQAAWRQFVREHLRLEPLVVTSRAAHPFMRLLIDEPDTLGADRIANVVAGYAKYHTALIIVDFGTAITFDCVSATGDYLGGAITAGVAVALDALAQATAKLPRVDISTPPPAVIATNTVDAITSGLLYGYGGLVDGLVGRLRQGIDPGPCKTVTVLATGGMAGLIAPYASTIEAVEPMLTLEGLRLIHQGSREK